MNLSTFHNEISLTDDGWAQLAVLGDYPGTAIIPVPPSTLNPQPSTDRVPAIQRIDREAIDAMVSKFNSPWGRIKRFMRGCFIYNGHPDVPSPERGSATRSQIDDEPKGMIAGLESRPDGLWCLPVFTDAGKSMLEKGKLYFSAVWTSALVGNENGKPVYRPEILVSAGLTPTPNLPVRLLNSAESADCSRRGQEAEPNAGSSRGNEAPIKSEIEQSGEKEVSLLTQVGTTGAISLRERAATSNENAQVQLCRRRGNETLTRSETEMSLLTQVGTTGAISLRERAATSNAPSISSTPSTLNHQPSTNTMNKQRIIEILGTHATGLTPESTDHQFETTLATLVANESTHRTNFANEREARITGLLNEGLNHGKFPANAKDTWLNKLRADFANAAIELAQMKPTLKFTSLTDGMGARKAGFANGSADLEKFHRLVSTKMATGLNYRQAFAAARAEDPTLLPE